MRTRRVPQADRLHVGYVRVSGYDQAKTGVSLESQVERIRAHATMRGVVLDEVIHDDGRSGSSVKGRPGMQRILGMVERGEVASVTVFKLDRGFRSVGDMSNAVTLMQKRGCEFISVSENIDTTTAVGKMMLNLLGSFAQFERDLGGERTAEALGHKRANGEVYSKQVPFGFRAVAGALVVDDAQQAVVARIVSLTAAKNGPTAIARTLNAAGIASPGGSTWYASSVASVLKTSKRLKETETRRAVAA